jgi:protein ImuB
MFACLHAPGNLPLAVECARGFSPYIEEMPPDTVIFDVRGLESLYGPARELAGEMERRIGVPASIAIAANPDAAMHAAHGLRGVTVIAAGREAEALAPLPLNLLGAGFPERMSAEMAELLNLWGIRTFGEFAKLPALGVAARLGDEGIHLQRLASGESHRQLRPMEDPLEFEEELELDDPVELIEPLAFILARLLNDVCGRLGARSLATNEIRLRLILEQSVENAGEHLVVMKLPVPMLDAKAFLKMLQLDLNGRPPVAAVLKVHLRAEPVKPRRTQHGLFLPSSPEPEKLELTVARLRHLVGEGQVGTPELLNTHRPDSFSMRGFAPQQARGPVALAELPVSAQGEVARLCLRRFRPPRYAQVIVVNRLPVRVVSPTVNGRVVMAKGPWRASGEWWRQDAWSRDEWDIALESGALYRLFQEVPAQKPGEGSGGRWFIEGSYD